MSYRFHNHQVRSYPLDKMLPRGDTIGYSLPRGSRHLARTQALRMHADRVTQRRHMAQQRRRNRELCKASV